jgi:hypothetical protein
MHHIDVTYSTPHNNYWKLFPLYYIELICSLRIFHIQVAIAVQSLEGCRSVGRRREAVCGCY